MTHVEILSVTGTCHTERLATGPRKVLCGVQCKLGSPRPEENDSLTGQWVNERHLPGKRLVRAPTKVGRRGSLTPGREGVSEPDCRTLLLVWFVVHCTWHKKTMIVRSRCS